MRVVQLALCGANSITFGGLSVMDEIASLRVQTVKHVPRSTRPLLAEVLSGEFLRACENGIWGFVRLFMFAKAVLRVPPRGGRKKRLVIKQLLLSRLRQWQQGNLVALWTAARQECQSRSTRQSVSIAKSNARRSLNLAREGRFGDAMKVLGSCGCASRDDPMVLDELKSRHPEHALPEWSDDIPPPLVVDSLAVLSALESFPRGSSPGFSQLRAQHLLDIMKGAYVPDAQLCLANLSRFMTKLLAGKCDPRIAPWLSGAPLTALLKKSGGFRPIAVGEVLRRLASKLCCASVKDRLPDVFLPTGQVGVGIRSGMESAIHTTQSFLDANWDKEDFCCLKIDMTNAFNECSRPAFLSRLRREFPELFAWAQWSYHVPSEMRYGRHQILSTAGVQQGDPLSPLLFSLVILELLDSIGAISNLHLQIWYLDDGTFFGSRESVSSLLQSVSEKGPSYGLHVNLNKCELYWPSGDQAFPLFPSQVRRLSEGVELLGSPVHGSVDFFRSSISKRVDKVLESQTLLSNLEDPQVELHLLRSCQSICKINHLLRTVTPALLTDQLRRFDVGLRRSLEIICRSSITDTAWLQATLPVRLGGLGLREAVKSAPAAYVGSCNSTKLLVQDFVRKACNSLASTNVPVPTSLLLEESESYLQSCSFLKNEHSHLLLDFNNSTQRQIQSKLDADLFNCLLNNASLRDRARLNSISTPHAGAWLRAIPNPNLGLSMLSHEFVISIRLWLGIKMFPSPPTSILCTCRQHIDPFGDHLISCGTGPERTRRHNALAEVIFQALLVKNKDVVKEVRCSGSDESRPGDVFHPDFLEGKPAYFDITVRNSLQPLYVTKAAVRAGAAAEAGEEQKDTRHEANVLATGGLFYPLVLETLGFWSPFSIKTLKAIASKTSAVSGIRFHQAFQNLTQQLSVQLWKYNARMLFRRIQLEVQDIDSWDIPTVA